MNEIIKGFMEISQEIGILKKENEMLKNELDKLQPKKSAMCDTCNYELISLGRFKCKVCGYEWSR